MSLEPRQPFLERTGPWGLSTALLILMAFFFILPSAFRGARMGLQNKENDVKDWLPSDFPETAELEWFAKHFAGESFVLATWPGCNVGDQRLRLLESKLLHESAQFRRQLLAELESKPEEREHIESLIRARELGRELELLPPGQPLDDWGGLNEKWLISSDRTWYYITPEGNLYRWDEPSNGPATAIRALRKRMGAYELKGTLITAFGKPSTAERVNPFYNDPSLMCAPLFETVQTGATIAEELSAEGGPLWPIDLTDAESRPLVARRRALQRLTGTLFAPAVPTGFDWTPESFKLAIAPEKQSDLPVGYESIVTTTLARFADERFNGDVSKLKMATTEVKTDAWYAVFDELKVAPPPRLTCLLVTLTEVAKDNLAYAIGRGVMGMPRGRLLELAAQCGVRPPPSPSAAPPPFNREPPDEIGGLPPLRMGGPPVDNIAIDEEGTVTLARLVGYCILVGVGLSYACFRSLKITLMLFLVGGASAMLSMSVVGWTGGRVDAILMSMPSLVYVLGLSGAIHLINYYRDEIRFRGRPGAATRALKHALVPCTLAAVTTAIGLASLFTSNLKPIANFGLYSALGVMATLAILFTYLPAALEVFAPRFAEDSDPSESPSKAKRKPTPPPNELAIWWANAGRWITTHHWGVTATCMIVLAIMSIGVFKIQTSVQLLKLFDSEARILRDYAWLEDNFGKLVPMEIIVRMPPSIQRDRVDAVASTETADAPNDDSNSADSLVSLTILERLEAMTRIRTVVTRALGEEGMGVVGQASSMDTFLPPLPPVSNGYSIVRSNFERQLLASRDELLQSDYLKIERNGPLAGSELWRLSLRVSALSDVDYGLFINDLQAAVAPVEDAYNVRAELIEKLNALGGTSGITGKQMVLVLGSDPVPNLDQAALMTAEGTFNNRSAFLSTLHELLGNEAIRRTIWLDPLSPTAKVQPGDENWDRFLSQFDVVLDVRGLDSGSTDLVSTTNSPSDDKFLDVASVVNRSVGKSVLDVAPKATVSSPGDLRSTPPSRVPVFDVARTATPQVVFTGVVPVVYKAQRTLLGSLFESIVMAFVLITAVMAVLLNPGSYPWGWLKPANLQIGLAAGVISMVPNIFPVLLVFGFMGHRNVLVDIGTMMTASVAMGVAVDDTIHFLSWFRQFLDEGKTRVEAVIETYRRVGPAMTQTTIVGGLGLFIFALSTFTPTQRFGTLMLVMLAAALVGDLVLLPALLAGPLGKCFKPRAVKPASHQMGSGQTAENPSNAPEDPSPHEPSPISGNDEEVAVPVLRLHTTRRTDNPHVTRRKG